MSCCVFCGRQILNKGSLKAHEASCKSNKDRVRFKRSDKAGAQKGTVSPFKGIKRGRNKVWDERFPLSAILIEHSTYPRHCLKKRILSEKLIEYVCDICKIGPEWMGKPMPLILDHINGINDDDRLENLRFVCSNCDSQLLTYKSRNRKNLED